MIFYTYLSTPIGKLLLTSSNDTLTGIYSMQQKNRPTPTKEWEQNDALSIFQVSAMQLEQYFASRLVVFTVAYTLHGTHFQKCVWETLQQIPYGQVISYKAFSALTAYPQGIRAVASAIAQNPLSIVLPCHRVIRSNGTLGGYALGLEVKNKLLQLERQLDAKSLS
jgi:O-6-methylguanine DNA methyltransferase